MKNLKHILTFSAGLAVMMSACSKGGNDSVTPAPSGPYASLAAAYSEVAPKSKTVSVNANAGGTFYGTTGTRYEFPPFAFQSAAGSLINGNVNVEVLECLTESDMIFGRMLTVSNGNPLMTAGEVYIKANQAGSPIYIRPGINYKVHLPAKRSAATSSMQYFSGAGTVSVPGSSITWNLRDMDVTPRIVYNADTVIMVSDSMTYIGAEKVPSGSVATANVKIAGVSASLKQENFNAYYLLDEGLSAVPIFSNTNAFLDNTYRGAKILRLNAHYVVCAVYEGEFYGGILKDATANDGGTYTVTISKTTPTAFKAMIDAL